MITFNPDRDRQIAVIDTTSRPVQIYPGLSRLDFESVQDTPDEILAPLNAQIRRLEGYCNQDTNEFFGQVTREILKTLGWRLYKPVPSRICTEFYTK